MLNWAIRFNICCFLDNNKYNSGHHSVECLLGAGSLASVSVSAGTAFDELQQFASLHDDWLFGHLGYDLKNETENLTSVHPDNIGFPDLFFFVPEVVIELTESELRIGTRGGGTQEIYQDIISAGYNDTTARGKSIDIRQRYSREEYLDTVRELQKHILRGDCYEINFCQEFYAENIILDPFILFLRLSEASPNPFAAFYRLGDKYLMCASPERYIKKSGNKVISQPIKGTLKRSASAANEMISDVEDIKNRLELLKSAKDRSENVMVVDLVRNDLSRICQEGSVKVDELFGIYTFPQVYQMISTISGELKSEMDWIELLRVTFPMGSMTGAPKRSVMLLIEKYERSKRGIFSGAVGYINPERDFDFNVVIRSVLYNRESGYLAFPAGSGITFYSDPESEYEECLLKVAAIRSVLEKA